MKQYTLDVAFEPVDPFYIFEDFMDQFRTEPPDLYLSCGDIFTAKTDCNTYYKADSYAVGRIRAGERIYPEYIRCENDELWLGIEVKGESRVHWAKADNFISDTQQFMNDSKESFQPYDGSVGFDTHEINSDQPGMENVLRYTGGYELWEDAVLLWNYPGSQYVDVVTVDENFYDNIQYIYRDEAGTWLYYNCPYPLFDADDTTVFAGDRCGWIFAEDTLRTDLGEEIPMLENNVELLLSRFLIYFPIVLAAAAVAGVSVIILKKFRKN